MRDLFSQCTCVRTYVSIMLRNVNLHSFVQLHSRAKNSCITCTDDGGARGRGMKLRLEDREEWRFLTMEDGKDSAAGPPQRTCFVELSAECSQWLATLRKIKQRSQCTKEAKSKRAKENKRNCKGRKHVVESLHMFNSTVVTPFGPSACAVRTYALARCGTRHHAHAYS